MVLEVGEAGRDRHRGLARPWQWLVRSWQARGWVEMMLEVGVHATRGLIMVMFSD